MITPNCNVTLRDEKLDGVALQIDIGLGAETIQESSLEVQTQQ